MPFIKFYLRKIIYFVKKQIIVWKQFTTTTRCFRIPFGTSGIQDQMRWSIDNIFPRLKFLKCIAERIYPRDPGQPNLRIQRVWSFAWDSSRRKFTKVPRYSCRRTGFTHEVVLDKRLKKK